MFKYHQFFLNIHFAFVFQVLKSAGPWHLCYFVAIMFWCSFYLVYLILAVLLRSFNEIRNKTYEEKAEEKVTLQAAADATDPKADEATTRLVSFF